MFGLRSLGVLIYGIFLERCIAHEEADFLRRNFVVLVEVVHWEGLSEDRITCESQLKVIFDL